MINFRNFIFSTFSKSAKIQQVVSPFINTFCRIEISAKDFCAVIQTLPSLLKIYIFFLQMKSISAKNLCQSVTFTQDSATELGSMFVVTMLKIIFSPHPPPFQKNGVGGEQSWRVWSMGESCYVKKSNKGFIKQNKICQ